jgi:hypothetical protein
LGHDQRHRSVIRAFGQKTDADLFVGFERKIPRPKLSAGTFGQALDHDAERSLALSGIFLELQILDLKVAPCRIVIPRHRQQTLNPLVGMFFQIRRGLAQRLVEGGLKFITLRGLGHSAESQKQKQQRAEKEPESEDNHE